jgi:hypothetical protein
MRLYSQRQAAPDDAPIHLDRAGAANAMLTAQVRALQAEFIADEIHQVLARRHAALLWLTVDHDLYGVE